MTRRAMSPGAALVAAVAVAVVVVVVCGTAVEGQSPYEGPRDLIPNLRLCRTMPEARTFPVSAPCFGGFFLFFVFPGLCGGTCVL